MTDPKQELHRNEAYRLEWEATDHLNRAMLAYLKAARERRDGAEDPRGAQTDAGRADTIRTMIQTSRPAA